MSTTKLPFEQINKETKPKRELALPIIIAAAVVIGVILGVFIFSPLTARLKYKKFIEYASDSTTYAYLNDSMTAVIDGETIAVNSEDIYYVYNFISTDSSPGVAIGNERKKEPDRGADILIEFGDGSTVSFWQFTDEEKSLYDKGETMFVSYRDGKYSYMYSTGTKSFSLLKLTLTD